jgi:membrane fusion protein (multidrug efflux system)
MLVIITGFVFQACSQKGGQASLQAPASASPELSVEGMIIKTERVDDKFYSTGTLLANEEVELRTEISGRITGIYFEEGSRVKKGQLLIKIDDSELKAQLKKLQIQQKLAESEEYRQQQLLKIEAVSQEEYDIALNQVNTLAAEVELLQSQIEKTSIYAPFSGTIGLRYASEGGYVTTANLIATMQQLDPIKVEFSVPERYAPQIKEGTIVRYEVTGFDEIFKAKVYAVESKIDVNTRTVRVRAQGANSHHQLRPGAFAQVEIVLSTYEDAILVPAEALVTELEGQKLFIAKDGKAKSQKVKTGIRTERLVQIVEGLAPQDTILLTGLMSVQEGAPLDFKVLRTSNAEVEIEQPNITL